jgi:hypothetical protein
MLRNMQQPQGGCGGSAPAGLPDTTHLLKMLQSMQGVQGGGNSNLAPLLSMAQSPQAAAVMKSLGIDPQQATALLSSLQQSQAANSANSAAEEKVVQCAACHEPLSDVQWQCIECSLGPLHEACRGAHPHSQFRTNHASDEAVARVLELSQGRLDRTAAVELLNAAQGNLERALDLLWDK